METPYMPNLSEELTSLKRLEDAGWMLESNGHYYYFRHNKTQQTMAIPYWVQELLNHFAIQVKVDTQKAVRNSLGLE
jgi:hypothetical protein